MRRQPVESLYDYPCSYLFRSYEALMDEGVELPALEPRRDDPLPVIDEKYVREHLGQFQTKKVPAKKELITGGRDWKE